MGKRKFNGEGTFYYSETLKRYIGQFTDPNTGKRKSVSDADEKKAKAKLRKAMADAENGKFTEKNTITIFNLGKELLELKYGANIICSNTLSRDKYTLEIINSELGDIRVQKLTRSQIQSFFNSLKEKYSNSTISKVYIMLNKIIEEALTRDLIIKNPIKNIIRTKSIKKDKNVRAFTIEEHKKFISIIQTHKYRNIFLIALNTGMRCGEVLALRPQDIDFKNKYIHVSRTISRNENEKAILKDSPKTSAGNRDIPFDEQLEFVLKSAIHNMRLNPNNLIFTNKGEIIPTSTLTSCFARICKKEKFEIKKGNTIINLHSLRHTFATRCIEAGMPAHVLQKILGHTDISTTINTYTTVFDKYKEDEISKVFEYKRINNI